MDYTVMFARVSNVILVRWPNGTFDQVLLDASGADGHDTYGIMLRVNPEHDSPTSIAARIACICAAWSQVLCARDEWWDTVETALCTNGIAVV
jgi:hypothetical protein